MIDVLERARKREREREGLVDGEKERDGTASEIGVAIYYFERSPNIHLRVSDAFELARQTILLAKPSMRH